jgi:hypothetical protein
MVSHLIVICLIALKNIRQGVQNYKAYLLVGVHVICYVICVWFKYSPQRLALEDPQSTGFPYSFAPT